MEVQRKMCFQERMSNWFDTASSQMTVTTTLDSDKVKAIGDLQRNSLSEIEGTGAGRGAERTRWEEM